MKELKNKKVLFVEDDLFIGEMVSRRMEMAGASCVWVKDGEEGLVQLKDAEFDIIITDLMMARMSGEEMIKKIKADEKLKDIPIVVFSNFVASKKDAEKIKKLGIDEIFVKSNIPLRNFIERLAEILNSK